MKKTEKDILRLRKKLNMKGADIQQIGSSFISISKELYELGNKFIDEGKCLWLRADEIWKEAVEAGIIKEIQYKFKRRRAK